jgi:hypothetical protein
VRNKAFKKWLGDWEMWFKKNFLLNGKPVIEIKGNRFTPKEGKTFIEQVSATTDWKATLHSPARCSPITAPTSKTQVPTERKGTRWK